MKFRNLRYYIKESFISIIRNRFMNIAAMITVACCIFVLIFSYIIVANVDHILSGVEDELTLSVFVLDEVPDDHLDYLGALITNIEHVTDVRFISSEEAMASFGARYSDDPDFFAGLAVDGLRILPHTFEIRVDNIVHQDQVRQVLELFVGVYFEQVRYAQEAVEMLIGINNAIRIGSLIVILFLGGVSVIIIINTIKLTVTNRQSEINIMQYVGATAWFIRWPFIFEGMITGFLGSLLPLIIGFFSYGELIRRADEVLPALSGLFDFLTTGQVFVVLIPASLLLGVLIGVIGSATSVKRHLHV